MLVGVHWKVTPHRLPARQMVCPHDAVQAEQVQPHVRCVHGEQPVQLHVNSLQAVWMVQLQFAVNAQPCVFSTQSSVTPPHSVMSSA